MKLVVSVAGERIGVAALGQPGNYCVGRHGGSSLHLSHPTVSARHARLAWDGARMEVADLTGGTRSWLDGACLAGARLWEPGTSLRLGAVVLEQLAGVEGDDPFCVTLSPSLGSLEPDPSLPATMPLMALEAPVAVQRRPRWERWLAGTAASAAAVAAAWVALFW